MKISKCDLCGNAVASPEFQKPDPTDEMGTYLICNDCSIDYLKWFDEDGGLTKLGKKMQKCGWIKPIEAI